MLVDAGVGQGRSRRSRHRLGAGDFALSTIPWSPKVIAHGRDREEARRRLVRALGDTILFGLPNNRAFLVSAAAPGASSRAKRRPVSWRALCARLR